jgi:hypothetical protein
MTAHASARFFDSFTVDGFGNYNGRFTLVVPPIDPGDWTSGDGFVNQLDLVIEDPDDSTYVWDISVWTSIAGSIPDSTVTAGFSFDSAAPTIWDGWGAFRVLKTSWNGPWGYTFPYGGIYDGGWSGPFDTHVITDLDLASDSDWNHEPFVPPPDPPDPPTITSPTVDQVITVEDEGADSVTVTWTPAGDHWEARITAGSTVGSTLVDSTSGAGTPTWTVDLPYVAGNRWAWVRIKDDTTGLWSSWTSVPFHVAIAVDTPLDCYEQDVLADTPTGFWLPGMLASHVVPDLSGNSYDMTDTWYPRGVIERRAGMGIVATSADWSAKPYFTLAGNVAPYEDQRILAVVIAANFRNDSGIPGTRPAPPDIDVPIYGGGVGGTVPGWTLLDDFTFDHDSASFPPGSLDLWSYRLALFEHIAAAGEDPDLELQFPVTFYDSGWSAGCFYLLDVLQAPDYVKRPITIDQILWGDLHGADGNWPTFTPPAERYATLNVGFAASNEPPSGSQWVQNGAAWPFGGTLGSVNPDEGRVDFHEASVAPPTRGWHYVGFSNPLAMLTVVLTGMDADYLELTADHPFCTVCDDMPEASATYATRRLSDDDALVTTADTADLFGAPAAADHSWTVEIVARHGTRLDVGDVLHVIAGPIDFTYYGDAAQTATAQEGGDHVETVNGTCWHHIITTYDAALARARTWLDGALVFDGAGDGVPGTTVGSIAPLWGAAIAAYATYDHSLSRRRVAAHIAQLCRGCPSLGGFLLGQAMSFN